MGGGGGKKKKKKKKKTSGTKAIRDAATGARSTILKLEQARYVVALGPEVRPRPLRGRLSGTRELSFGQLELDAAVLAIGVFGYCQGVSSRLELAEGHRRRDAAARCPWRSDTARPEIARADDSAQFDGKLGARDRPHIDVPVDEAQHPERMSPGICFFQIREARRRSCRSRACLPAAGRRLAGVRKKRPPRLGRRNGRRRRGCPGRSPRIARRRPKKSRTVARELLQGALRQRRR